MSIATEIIAGKNDAIVYAAAEMEKRQPRKKKIYKPHLSTKVRWVLEDAEANMIEAQGVMEKVLAWVELERERHQNDVAYLARLGQLDHYVARVALSVTKTERMIATARMESKRAKDDE